MLQYLFRSTIQPCFRYAQIGTQRLTGSVFPVSPPVYFLAYRRASRPGALLLVLLMLTGMPAYSASYAFPGNLPASCSGGDGSYTCDTLTLADGDSLSIAVPTTIIVNGDSAVGANSRINDGGAASDLILQVMGTTDTGKNSTITANLAGAGVVTLGSTVKFIGNIKTQSAAINVGDFSTVLGSLKTVVAGVVNMGANNYLTGDVSTLSGAINVGANSRIDGSISSALAGVVTLGAGVTVGGNITTASGAINVGAGSNVTGFVMDTIAGAVTLGDNATVRGGIGSNAGAITLGTGSSATGTVCSGRSGAITLHDNALIGGNLKTKEGAITVGNMSTVNGTVSADDGAVTISSSAKIGAVSSKILCPLDRLEMLARGAGTPVIKSREWRQIFMR